MITENALHILFRRIQPEAVIKHWLSTPEGALPLSIKPNMLAFNTALQNDFNHYSTLESDYVYEYFDKSQSNSTLGQGYKSYGIFGLVAKAAEPYLTLDSRDECLCKYKCLLHFRELTHTIDPTVFVTAFLAMYDIKSGRMSRDTFSWSPVIRTDNIRLHHILDKGMAENHFHIGGSIDSFLFSWVCLMNRYSPQRIDDFKKVGMDQDPLDTVHVGAIEPTQSSYLLTFKAACIRYYLYCILTSVFEVNNVNREWLIERMNISSDVECHQYIDDLQQRIFALSNECKSEFRDGFIPDYAICGEPLPTFDDDDLLNYSSLAVRNYERRLYRPFAGEQRFLYLLFRAIFQDDSRIMPFLDLAYVYLLVYCRIRGELVQVNNRVGFSNFSKYQDRKDTFVTPYPEYDALRTRIAEQVVLANPQIVAFEGRLVPAKTTEGMLDKIKLLYQHASESPYDNLSESGVALENRIRNNAQQKMHYVLHFPKKSQSISDDEELEIYNPRNSKKRLDVAEQTNAIIAAMNTDAATMSRVTGIDACSEEIDCRPEVFSCYFRRIRQHRVPLVDPAINIPLPQCRITYHAGEDFLDPIDGLRAIHEAIRFCEMRGGDRLGHALALGIDCEEWYATKGQTVLLRKQALLDNLVWLYGQMHHFNIENPSAEYHIQNQFKKYFTEIYTRNAPIPNSLLYSVDVMDYYSSFGLRGNDPMLYLMNPEDPRNRKKILDELKNVYEMEPWRLRKGTPNYDELSMILYHYYHFNYEMKKKSDEIVEYSVPRCIVETVCVLQEKMRYYISNQNIGIECNPSSNYLIGTFKNYLKHPIFKFNNKHLFPQYDPRSQIRNPYILASINTDDLGIFNTSLENEYALMACALEANNEYCGEDQTIPPDNIYSWLDAIRQNGIDQSFIRVIKTNS